jgi:hypothetical protein
MPADSKVSYVLVGDGPDRATLTGAAQARGLLNVQILPSRPVEQMPALNAMADALLVHLKDEPFLHETVPSKTQVSLLAGRPILMGCRGEAARIIESARAGIAFLPESGTDLARSAHTLSLMPEPELQAMARRGSEYYWNNLSLAAGARVMAKLFSETAGNPVEIPRQLIDHRSLQSH